MRLTCPACGAQCSLEAWGEDAHARHALNEVAHMPEGVARCAPGYLALFRPAASGSGSRGLRWDKAARLLADLRRLVSEAHISWQGKPARPNRAAAWARAMERIIEQPPRRLPLKSHGYLTAMAYEIADEMDRADEVKHNRAERSGALLDRRREQKEASQLSADDMAEIEKIREKIKRRSQQ